MAGHTLKATISTGDIRLDFECNDPATCDVQADDGKCWPAHYADQDDCVQEYYDGPDMPLISGAAVRFWGYDDEWHWTIVTPKEAPDA